MSFTGRNQAGRLYIIYGFPFPSSTTLLLCNAHFDILDEVYIKIVMKDKICGLESLILNSIP